MQSVIGDPPEPVDPESDQQSIEDLAIYAAWLMRIASKEINSFVEEHNKKVEPWHFKDAMTSFELDKAAWLIERHLKDEVAK